MATWVDFVNVCTGSMFSEMPNGHLVLAHWNWGKKLQTSNVRWEIGLDYFSNPSHVFSLWGFVQINESLVVRGSAEDFDKWKTWSRKLILMPCAMRRGLMQHLAHFVEEVPSWLNRWICALRFQSGPVRSLVYSCATLQNFGNKERIQYYALTN